MVFQRKKILERLTLSPVPHLIYFCRKALPYSFLFKIKAHLLRIVCIPLHGLTLFFPWLPLCCLPGPVHIPSVILLSLHKCFSLASSYCLYLQDLQDPPGLLTFPSQRQFSFDVQISCYTIIIFVSYSFSCLKYSKEYSWHKRVSQCFKNNCTNKPRFLPM